MELGEAGAGLQIVGVGSAVTGAVPITIGLSALGFVTVGYAGTVLCASSYNFQKYFSELLASNSGKGVGNSVEWTSHGFKHFPQKNMSWNDIVKSTKFGDARYAKDINIEGLERMAWENGTSVTNGKTWKVMEFDNVIGACSGKETKYMRVEFSSGTIHGHPITAEEYKKLLK